MLYDHTGNRKFFSSRLHQLGVALVFGLALTMGLLGAFSLDGARRRSAYAAPPSGPALQSSQSTTTTITSDQPDPSLVGESVTVSFTVAADSAAPTGTVTVTLSMGTYTGTLGFGVDVCTDTLTEGPSVTSTGVCTLMPTIAGSGTLTATYGGEGDFGSSLDTEPHRVTDSDLSIAKTADPDPATAGRSMVYTLTIANRGSVSATNVTISDTLPSSLTLHSVDQTDDNSGDFSFPNGTHQNTIWDTGRPATGEDDWLRIMNTVTPTGVYTSSVLDGYNLVEWDELHWVPRRPYGKPLPDWGQAESAYDRGNANMTGNAVLLHLDALYSASYPTGTVVLPPTDSRGTVSDTSGLDTPVACPAAPDQHESCPSVTTDGRFGRAFDFDGALSQTVVISDATDPARYALELWVRPDVVTDASLILRTNAVYTDTARRYSHILGIADGHFQHTVYDGEYRTITSTTPVTADTWYHLVGTAQSGGDLALYVNGEREAQMGGLDTVWTKGDHYRLGSGYFTTRTTECLSGTLQIPYVVTDTRAYFSGSLDEVAIYSRTLASAEIRDHYLRGALQLQLEARSCAQADCADGVWDGPYSEADNPALDLPEAAIDVPDNRYFQYRATLTTEDASFSPELHSTTVHPGHRAVTATQGSCWATYHAFTCTLGTLAPGQVVTVSAGASIHPSALGVITNTASVTAPGDVIIANNTVALTTTVNAEADLVVLKHDDESEWDGDRDIDWDVGGSDPVNPGSTLTYTLRVRNGGPSTARWVTVTDQLPGGLIGYATGDAGWTCGPPSNTITCTLESLYPTYSWRDQYDWEHIVITATAPLTESVITNTAWITSATFETITDTTESNLVTETTSIAPVADVSIDKLDAPDPVDPGATLLYTVTVTNHGPYTNVTGVVVTDTLPDGLEAHVVDGGDWSCSTSDGQLICDLLHPLTPTLSASFNVTVTAPMSGFLANYVHVTAAPHDPDDDNNWDTAYTAVRPVADLFVSKHDTPDPVNAAAPLTYTVIVTNTGPVDAGAFSTTVEASNGHDFRIHPRGGRAAPYRTSIYLSSVPGLLRDLTVTLHDVSHSYPNDLSLLLVGPDERAVVLMANAGGGSDVDDLTLTFNDDGVAVGEPITSTVVYRPTNNGFSEDFEPPAPAGPYGSSLSTFYNADPNGHWRLYVYDTVYSDGGSIGGWSLEVTGSTTDTVTLSDTLPAELSGVNVTSPSGWNCGAGTDPLMCEADWLPVDVPAVFTVTATAPITGGPSTGSGQTVITNTVAVTSTIADLGPHANTATITTTVAAVADLGISKRVMPSDVVEPGAPLTYTLTVSNAGPSPLLNPLVVTDTLPAGLTGVGASGADWNCDALTPTMTCTRTNGLSVGATSEIVITANAPLTPETVLTNTVSVTATAIDPASINNSATVTITVGEQAIAGLSATNDGPTVLGNPTFFTAVITAGSNVTYEWGFGDGETGSGNPISHTYGVTGTYTAVVTASNSASSMTATTQVEIINLQRIYLPLVMRNYVAAPDLVVERIVATADQVQVVIANVGDVSVPDEEESEFWVDLYVNPDGVPAYNETWELIADQGAVWGITWGGSSYSPSDPARQALPLEPGEAFTLTTGGDYYWAGESDVTWPLTETVVIYAQVDTAHADTAYGGVLENHEIVGGPYNNVTGPSSIGESGKPLPCSPSLALEGCAMTQRDERKRVQ